MPPLPAAVAPLCRMGGALHADPARHGGAHDDGRPAVFEPVRPRFGVQASRARAEPPRLTPARKRALEIAADGLVRAKSALATEAGCTTGVVDGLVAAGSLVEVAIPERRYPRPNPAHRQGRIRRRTRPRRRTPCALRSTRGLLRHAPRWRHRLRQDGGLFRGRGPHAGAGPAGADHAAGNRADQPVHGPLRRPLRLRCRSNGTPRSRRRSARAPGGPPQRAKRAWSSAHARRCSCPIVDLGLIVVDEEHDQGFKQDDRVHYQARDMAVVRASLGSFPVVLASATPSVESHVNARTGRYRARGAAGSLFRCGPAGGVGHRHAQGPARQGPVAGPAARRGRHRDARAQRSSRFCISIAAAMRR